MKEWEKTIQEHKPKNITHEPNRTKTDENTNTTNPNQPKNNNQQPDTNQSKAEQIRQHLRNNEYTNIKWLSDKYNTKEQYIRNVKHRMKQD